MSVKKEASGRRSVHVDVEVPGTPQQVWQAIATGPGITSWFAPTELEERAGGKLVIHMMPGMDAEATITAWQPPLRLVAEAPGWVPGMPAVATEWTVEALAGGTCRVRVVHSFFAATDDWDNQLEGTVSGWPGYFRILRLYLKHFPGQKCSPIRVLATPAGSPPDAWQKLIAALGLAGSAVGQKKSAAATAPPFTGIVEHVEDQAMDLLVRLEEPAEGILAIGAFDCGATMAGVYFYLFGERGAKAAASEESRWKAWVNQLLPAATVASAAPGD